MVVRIKHQIMNILPEAATGAGQEYIDDYGVVPCLFLPLGCAAYYNQCQYLKDRRLLALRGWYEGELIVAAVLSSGQLCHLHAKKLALLNAVIHTDGHIEFMRQWTPGQLEKLMSKWAVPVIDDGEARAYIPFWHQSPAEFVDELQSVAADPKPDIDSRRLPFMYRFTDRHLHYGETVVDEYGIAWTVVGARTEHRPYALIIKNSITEKEFMVLPGMFNSRIVHEESNPPRKPPKRKNPKRRHRRILKITRTPE